MKQETINKIIKHLTNILQENISIKDYQIKYNLNEQFIYSQINKVKNDDNVSDEDYNTIMDLYGKIKSIKEVVVKDLEQTDKNYQHIDVVRDENGKIVSYKFEIYIKNKNSLRGTFTRDEMSLIYRLYSSYGSNITQREVSRFFPEYSLYDFKRILRAFNITKASSPFPQHVIEENSKETLLEMQFREKENDFLKSYEADKVRQLDIQLKKYIKENADLKNQLNEFDGLLSTIDLSKVTYIKPSNHVHVEETKDLFIWLSDMHIGASVDNDSIYINEYNQSEVNSRLNTIYETVFSDEGYDNIIICNLGDSLDGYKGETTRGGHGLPQNMNNKEQVKCFIEEMVTFIGKLSNIPNNGMYYYAVGESNHGGDFEYAAQIGLKHILESMNIQCTIFDKFIGLFEHKGRNYCICHGKDSQDMFKNWPLTLNDKTENFINQFLDSNNIYEAVVVKGDLHQSATTYGKRFIYKSVGSLFGSSNWIHVNFGFTRACCDYSIIGENILDGRVVLN